MNVTLTWVASTESDLLKYRVYNGPASGVSTANQDVTAPSPEAAPDTSVTINNLPDGKPWYFWITAFDLTLNESTVSNVVTVANKYAKVG